MNWKDIYKSRLVSAEDAVTSIRSGNRVVIGHAGGSPDMLLKTLVDNKKAYENVEIIQMVTLGDAEYCTMESEGHFIHNSFFAGGNTRKAINDGRAVYTPTHFSQIPRLFKENVLPVDVALCMVSPPDEHGYCSFGISVDYTKPATESAKTVIAEVTPYMPRTLGDSLIHVSKIDKIVESFSKPMIMDPPMISEQDRRIGGFCAELIKDGDCLQLGSGPVTESILEFMKERKDLGIHTEMLSDGVINLVETGSVTCARKNFLPGRIVATSLLGTERLYRFVHNNYMVNLFPADYTNNPAIIARNDNMVSINSVLQIDLLGQVASESIGYKQFSGTGGQDDFIRGASWSNGGRTILAFHSTVLGGTISRIVPYLYKGAAVTTTSSDIHYVVTEYGVADLRGKAVHERAMALINIAHPDFRSDLKSFLRRSSRLHDKEWFRRNSFKQQGRRVAVLLMPWKRLLSRGYNAI